MLRSTPFFELSFEIRIALTVSLGCYIEDGTKLTHPTLRSANKTSTARLGIMLDSPLLPWYCPSALHGRWNAILTRTGRYFIWLIY